MPQEDLLQQGFRKPGLFARWFHSSIRQSWGGNCDSCIWIKNPTFRYFDDFRTQAVGNNSKARSVDEIYGTSVYAFIKNGMVIGIHAQIFQSAIYAGGFANEFRSCALGQFGPCLCTSPILIPRYSNDSQGDRNTALTAWADEDTYLICGLSSSGDSSFVQFAKGDVPSALKRQLTASAKTLDDLSNRKPSLSLDDYERLGRIDE
jgi:hypothetical protein